MTAAGAEQASNPIHHMLGIANPTEKRAGKNFIYLPNCPGKAYYAQLHKEFNQAAAAGTFESAEFNRAEEGVCSRCTESLESSTGRGGRCLAICLHPDRQS